MEVLNVFLTVDVELWPESWNDLSANELRRALSRYIYGHTPQGNYGLPFQLKLLRECDIKATFFVESLFAEGFGLSALTEIVDLIGFWGQDVQVHLHSEWVDKFPVPILPDCSGMNINQFGEAEQRVLIEKAVQNLIRSGLDRVCAFRAGNYGADLRTLRALRDNDIAFDTSYNYNYVTSSCGLHISRPLVQPAVSEGIWEFPVTRCSS